MFVEIVPFLREEMLARLRRDRFDVLVVGGGITGAGVALDAATRGLHVALVERDDFAAGTSSKSSKLVHGGLRYLQQRDFSLVYEALYERQIALRNAPHLVRVLPFLLPVLTRDGLLPRRLARALGSALWLYDLTGGARIGKVHRRIRTRRALAHMPTLREDRLAAAYLYYDAQADDARLTLAVARTAARHGAVVLNHARVVGFTRGVAPGPETPPPAGAGGPAGRITGAVVEADGERIEVRADCVVNATGVWADELRALDEGADPGSLRPAKGVHITVPWERVRNDIAAILPVPRDRRSIFVVPWGDVTYIGTTDTDYDGPLDEVTCTPDDVGYLLGALRPALVDPPGPDAVVATWAGLRPLVSGGSVGDKTADLSRRHQVHTSPSGLVTVTGGKLTTYRRMAADTLDVVVARLGRGGRCRTKRLPLVGAEGPVPDDAHLARRFGSEAAEVLRLAEGEPGLAGPLVPGLPYRAAEAVFAVRHEMACTLDDVLSRRTRARLLSWEATWSAVDDVATLIGRELGWDDARRRHEVACFRAALAAERDAAGLGAGVAR